MTGLLDLNIILGKLGVRVKLEVVEYTNKSQKMSLSYKNKFGRFPSSKSRQIVTDFQEFLFGWWIFLSVPTKRGFFRFESVKATFAQGLYKQRGKLSRPFIHSGMMGIALTGIMLAPIVSETLPGGTNPWQLPTPSAVLSATTDNPETQTQVSDKARDLKTIHTVVDGDTIASIAQKFGLDADSVMWANDLTKKSVLKPGQKLTILPANGVLHKVEKGENIYSIAKKYEAEPQGIVDFPFNTFVNDETFALAQGQELFIPDGIRREEAAPRTGLARRQTPNAGTVTASGSFAWPTSGSITQNFTWYHTGIDIANRGAPDILAADSGTVILAGWPDNGGYGMRVEIDHGNGYITLYAHLQATYVTQGQTIRRGEALGKMGSTGRSTGIHLHFEVFRGGTKTNPMEYLK